MLGPSLDLLDLCKDTETQRLRVFSWVCERRDGEDHLASTTTQTEIWARRREPALTFQKVVLPQICLCTDYTPVFLWVCAAAVAAEAA